MAERGYRQPLPPPRCLSKLLFNRQKLNICVGLLSSIPDFLHYISTQTCTTIKHIVEHHLNATHSFLIARLSDQETVRSVEMMFNDVLYGRTSLCRYVMQEIRMLLSRPTQILSFYLLNRSLLKQRGGGNGCL